MTPGVASRSRAVGLLDSLGFFGEEERGMRRRAVLAVASAAAVVATGVVATGGGAQAPGERTFTLIEQFNPATVGFADTPPRARNRRMPNWSRGDGLTFVNSLRTEAGQRVGDFHVSCTATRPGTFPRATFLCRGAFVVRDGVITATAVIRAGQALGGRWAIDGGTGAYEGARGSAVSVPGPQGRTATTFHLLP